MAAKKFYAVKKGMQPGIFSCWEDCKPTVEGYPGAVFRGFATLTEARQYLGDPDAPVIGGSRTLPKEEREEEPPLEERPPKGELLAYVDGSYSDSLKRYAFGCVFLLSDGRIYTECGSGCDPASLQHRNVTGEMLGAMYAVKFAMLNGFGAVEIRYDYAGIEKWVTGEWKSTKELTGKYAAAMRKWGTQISITFTKVAAHTNVTYNELADRTAKRGLTEAEGVPEVKRLEEMSVWKPFD